MNKGNNLDHIRDATKKVNLDRLKAVSETMIYHVKLALKMKRLDAENEYQSVRSKDILTIAADLLRLADRNEENTQALLSMGSLLITHPHLCTKEFRKVVWIGDKKTPASPKKPDDEE